MLRGAGNLLRGNICIKAAADHMAKPDGSDAQATLADSPTSVQIRTKAEHGVHLTLH
jgi:hypothetical protein